MRKYTRYARYTNHTTTATLLVLNTTRYLFCSESVGIPEMTKATCCVQFVLYTTAVRKYILYFLLRRLFSVWRMSCFLGVFSHGRSLICAARLHSVSTCRCLESACCGHLLTAVPCGTIIYPMDGGCRREPYHAGKFVIEPAVGAGANHTMRGDSLSIGRWVLARILPCGEIFPNESGCKRGPYHAWIHIQSAVGVSVNHTMRGELFSNE